MPFHFLQEIRTLTSVLMKTIITYVVSSNLSYYIKVMHVLLVVPPPVNLLGEKKLSLWVSPLMRECGKEGWGRARVRKCSGTGALGEVIGGTLGEHCEEHRKSIREHGSFQGSSGRSWRKHRSTWGSIGEHWEERRGH